MATAAPSFARVAALLRERRYRQRFFEADRRQTGLVMVGMTLGGSVAARNDFALLDGTPALGAALLCRLLGVVALVVTLALLRGAARPRQLDRAFTGWLGLWSLLQLGVIATRYRTGECVGPLVGQGAVIIALCFALRGPMAPRALAAVVTSAGVILLLWAPGAEITSAARFTGTAVLIAGNIFSFASMRAFEENRRKRFDAEHQLALRVRELAAEKEHAMALSRTRAAFLATMSHEFRTPMNAVIGLSELLLAEPLAAEHRRHVHLISESARALLTQLNDILDFTKIDADKLALATAPFDMRRLAASVADMLRPAAATRSLDLSVNVSSDVPAYVTGDDARLRQVLVNLVSNAVKFTERGRIALRIAARRFAGDDEGHHGITFRVEDTGPGMTPAMLARLFQPFEQADARSAEAHGGGTGLGLAISRRIVRAMGGDIHVASEPGSGSAFSFSLRLPAADAPADADALPPSPREDRPLLAVLVVDDHPVNREVAQAWIGKLGARVDLAEDGAEAIEAVSKSEYDVVFMDLRMPGMSGIEATQRIRERLAGRREPYIVAMTASVFEEDREACRRAGMRDFIGKPIHLAQVEGVLARVAEERGLSRPRGVTTATLAPEPLARLRQVERSGAPRYFAEVCRRYMADMKRRVPRIADALARGDREAIEEETHTLRATSAAVGATVLADLCRRAESAARAGRLEEIHPLLEGIRAQAGEVERALGRELGEERPRPVAEAP